MKFKKVFYKIFSIFLGICLIFLINVLPIGAVVVSGGQDSYDLTQKSTFPLTVGFCYRTIPSDTSLTPTYIMAKDFGGFGQEFQSASGGQDYYSFSYKPTVDSTTTIGAKGVYYYQYLDRQYPDSFSVSYQDGQNISTYKMGYQRLRLNNSAFFSSDYDPSEEYMNNLEGRQVGLVFRSRDVFYDTHWLYDQDYRWIDDPLQCMLPCIIFFNNDQMSSDVFQRDDAYYVYSYIWSCTLTTAGGELLSFDGSFSFNTLTDSTFYCPVIPLNVLRGAASTGSTIIINEFSGILMVDYYERPKQEVINGVWKLKDPVVNSPIFGNEFSGSSVYGIGKVLTSNGATYTDGVRWGSTLSGHPDYTSSFLTNGTWLFGSPNWASEHDTHTGQNLYFGGADLITISDWNYQDSPNAIIYDALTLHYSQLSQGEGPPGGGTSSDYTKRLLGGMGLSLDICYPLYDTSNVFLSGNDIYNEYFLAYGYPDAQKYIKEYGDLYPVSGLYPSYQGSSFTDWLVSAVGGFMSFELWPGFSFSSVLAVCISVPLCIWFLKLFAGG